MTTRFHADQQGSPDSISADLEAALAGVTFPANKDTILDAAAESGVSNEIITVLTGIEERDYANASAVLKQLG
jgi:hypothetical protein